MSDKEYKTRPLTDGEVSFIRFSLTFRGANSLAGAVLIVIFAVMLSIYGRPLFADRGISMLCHGGIWIAVVAVIFGLVRTGIQSLAWRNGRHIGIIAKKKPAGVFEFVFNILAALVFIGLGVAILLSDGSAVDGLRTAVQIPLAILTISLGLGSAESCAMFIWRHKTGLDDVLHELEENPDNQKHNNQ